MAFPAARVGDFHFCKHTEPGPHIGGAIMGPIAGSEQFEVYIGKKLAATVGSPCDCAFPDVPLPNIILKGSSTVFIHGKEAARFFDTTTHTGGQIVEGESTVLIGDCAALGAETIFPGHQSYGNCAVQCVEQIICQATGISHSEDEMLAIASQYGVDKDGGMSMPNIVKLLRDFGVEATHYDVSNKDSPITQDQLEDIKQAFSILLRDNRAAIVQVNAGALWKDLDEYGHSHAVLLTEGDFNGIGELTHVYISDTGHVTVPRRRLTPDQLQRAMTSFNNGITYYSFISTRDPIWNQIRPWRRRT